MTSSGVKEMTLIPADEPQPETPKPGEALPQVADSVGMFERMARDPNMDVDKLERLMQMYERAKARAAEEQFNAAMTAAQMKMRPIAADATNPETHSKYASYEALDRALRPIYTEHGFGVSFDTGDSPIAEHVRVLAYVSHSGGHSRTYRVDMPSDGKGPKGGAVMSRTHASGAAMSYGMRYLQKMIWNVAVGEDDVDGNTPKEIPQPPADFTKWWEGMADVVPEGLARYRSVWKESKQEYCDYVLAYMRDVHEFRKTKAEAADKARKVATK